MATDLGGLAPAGGAPSPQGSPRSGLLALTTSFGTAQLTAITAFIVALAAAVAKLQDLAKALNISPPLCALLLTSLLLLLFFFHTLPSILEDRKKARLASIQGASHAGYFQLTVRKDEETFQRADGKHEEVLKWLRNPPRRVLYLTGSSGAGKSSVLEAWALPKLKREGVTIIRLRGYQDPAKALEDELKRPGAIWKNDAPDTQDLHALFEQAAQRVQPSRILVVFDQFEEFLILQQEAQRSRFVQFLTAQKEAQDSSSATLLVFRSEYDGFIDDLDLPPPIYGENFQKVSAFTVRAAQEFLAGSDLKINPELEADVLNEAARVDDTPGMIRPVTLNVCGLVLERFSTGLPRAYRPGHLIRGFVRQAIFDKQVPAATPVLLRKLISSERTKSPRTISELAEGTTFTPRQAQGAMFKLADPERGIVHPLDPDCHVWEISHDFLVPIIDSLLAGWTKSIWSYVRPWLPIAYAAVFASLLYVAPRLFPDPVSGLNKLGWQVREYDDASAADRGVRYEFTYNSKNGSGPPLKSSRSLRRVRGKYIVRLVGLAQFDEAQFADWRNLTQLWGVFLGGDHLTDTSGLRDLPPTTAQLGIAGTGEVTVAEVARLPRTLTWLNLENDRGVNGAVLKQLPPRLTSLDLNNDDIQDADLEFLPNTLTWLKLGSAKRITDAGLKHLPPRLNTLFLSRIPQLHDAGLKNLPPRLTVLHIDHDPGITDAGLKNLPPGLTRLDLTADPQITDAGLKNLPPGLTRLDLTGDPQITDPAIHALSRTITDVVHPN